MKKSLGKILKEARLKKGYVIQELSKKLKVSGTYIHKIESTEEIPKKEILIELCKILDLNVNKLIEIAIKKKLEVYEQQLREKYSIE